METCVEKFSGALLKAVVPSPLNIARVVLSDNGQNSERRKAKKPFEEEVAGRHVTHPGCIGYSPQTTVTPHLNEVRIDEWSATLESFDPEGQTLWRITERVMRVPALCFPAYSPGIHSLIS